MRAISRVYTGGQVRALDRILIEEFDVPGISLMKRAGLFAFDRLCELWQGVRSISVVCGSGNNAGDGYIVAGLAHNRGVRVQLIQIGNAQGLKGNAETAYRWALEQGVVRGSRRLSTVRSLLTRCWARAVLDRSVIVMLQVSI